MADTHIRGVDPELWHQLRVIAVQREVPLGQLLNEILTEWLKAQPNR